MVHSSLCNATVEGLVNQLFCESLGEGLRAGRPEVRKENYLWRLGIKLEELGQK